MSKRLGGNAQEGSAPIESGTAQLIPYNHIGFKTVHLLSVENTVSKLL
jgi:hypothetical protein